MNLVQGLKSLRPRWVWILLGFGLIWLLTPLSCSASVTGCLTIPLAWAFWIATFSLTLLGLRWLWRKLLFKVSRRLWVILLLVSLLPVITLTTFFLAFAWLGLGAQVSRSIQGNIKQYENALSLAAEERSDSAALQSFQVLGEAWVSHTDSLPKGMKPGIPVLIYTRVQDKKDLKDVFMRVATPSANGFRLLTLNIHDLGQRGRKVWGGRIHYRLDLSSESANSEKDGKSPKKVRTRSNQGDMALEGATMFSKREPIATWTLGEVEQGRGILHTFKLPPVALRTLDWETGRPMTLTLRPETSLREIFLGFGFGEGNLSAQAFLVMALLVTAVILLGCLQGVAFLMGLGLARNLGRSVEELFRGVARLANGDFSVRIRPRSKDQVAQLTTAFNEMAERLEVANSERSERLRLEEELRVAREVQMRLLPDVSALAPAIRATILPAREVAGDYFDLFKLPDGRYAFLIADVSGKGTSAAFYAAETKGVLAALDKVALGPREVLTRLNEIWCETHPRQVFLTAIYGIFDPHDGVFSFARAGHPSGFLRRASGVVERLNPKGIGIGMSRNRFEELLGLAEGRLEPGDSLLLFTDGLSEAQNPDGELFGENRLEAALAQGPGDPKTSVLLAVDAFLEGRPLEDDLTLLVLER
ncbi:MAG: SpoIIE family protein phosphatase [Holophaga sp.]|nr:SpoIIE family protein phosphatase [Holophaga sp.]